MKLLNRLERKFGGLAIPHLTLFILALQGFSWAMMQVQPAFVLKLILTHESLLAGQWWRLLTVLFIPPLFAFSPGINLLLLFVFFYFFYMIGTALEAQWGTFKYNLFLLIGYVATVLVALIPGAIVDNFYLMESIFLAFAWLFPELPILLFFILPVKVKWLGLAAWLWYGWTLLDGTWPQRAEVMAGTVNFVIFFHDDLWYWLRTSRRKIKGSVTRAKAREEQDKPMHVCAVCGVTELSDRKMEFRYCPLCTGTPAYCINHIGNHVHK